MIFQSSTLFCKLCLYVLHELLNYFQYISFMLLNIDSFNIVILQSQVQTSVLGLGVDFVLHLSQQQEEEQEDEEEEQQQASLPKSIRRGVLEV